MNKNSGLKWTIKNSKKQMPWIIALSVSNIVLADWHYISIGK